MIARIILAVLLLLGGIARAEEMRPPKRVALVIGNAEYRTVERLQNPGSDARLMAFTLKELGFTLVDDGPKLNLDRAGLEAAVAAFGRALQGADVALFYYSGHGLQVGGVNWLVPVDANPTRPQDLDFQMLDADLVLKQMDGAGTKLNIVILDACRNNPFTVRGLRGLGGGLAEMRAPEGTLISYATQPGSVAHDGDGQNSPYTAALATMMRRPGLDIFRTFNEVGLQVKRATGGEQQPWVSNSPIDGDFAFAGAMPQAGALIQPLPAPAVAPPPESSRRAVAPQPVPPPPPAPKRTTPVSNRAAPAPRPSSHCADIIARAQLGEPLSASEQAALSRGCGG